MQLDKTQIAIRERAMPDILDISLHVMRAYWVPLLITFCFGMIPLMVLNELLVGWLDEISFFTHLRLLWSNRSADYPYVEQFPYWYMLNMMLLVVVEAQLVSIFATSYIGQAVFQEQPSIRQVVHDVIRYFPRICWCQLLFRAILPMWIFYLLIAQGDSGIGAIGFWPLPAFLVYCLCLRAVRPFINEIVILEKNPLRPTRDHAMTVRRRSSLLHGPNIGDSLLRSISAIFVGLMLWVGCYGVFLFFSGVFLDEWKQWPITVHVIYPISMWMVAFFFTIVRYMSYLDVRIRQEGWEVELKLRAEAAKLVAEKT